MTAASLKLFTHSKKLLPLVGAMMPDLPRVPRNSVRLEHRLRV